LRQAFNRDRCRRIISITHCCWLALKHCPLFWLPSSAIFLSSHLFFSYCILHLNYFCKSFNAGAVSFLFFLAFGAWKKLAEAEKAGSLPLPSQSKTLIKAVSVNLLNPNPYLGWSLVMGPLFLAGLERKSRQRHRLLGGFIVH